MPNLSKYNRVNVNHSDYNRVVITDTAPYETPVIFSNDGFYENLNSIDEGSKQKVDLVKSLLGYEVKSKYTIPYRYNILRENGNFRTLSLLHPSSQLKVVSFYKEYESLISYYCSKSVSSIRSPYRTASSFFYKRSFSETNKYKSSLVDTEKTDKFVRNAASFFAYRGYNRLYKFFEGNDYLRLEKKYRHMCSLDISKCFDSIYTHTISWAVKGVEISKENTRASTFGNNFDHLMQKMNFNETNGICIGSETSRVFAEIILSEIDRNVKLDLEKSNILNRREYEYRRYVDDFFIFANENDVLDAVRASIESNLAKYKLFLNQQKIEFFERPFQTKKSKIIDGIQLNINEFTDKTLRYERLDGRLIAVPNYIWKPNNLIRWFIKQIKSNCYDGNVTYEMVSNYIIATLTKRIQQLADSMDVLTDLEDVPKQEFYVVTVITILEIIFFFFTVHPTTNSSYNVSKAVLLAGEIFKVHMPDRVEYLLSCLFRWATQIIRDNNNVTTLKESDSVPIEIINIILAIRDLSDNEIFDELTLTKRVFNSDRAEYFSIISLLYYIKNDGAFKETKIVLVKKIKDIIEGCGNLKIDSHSAHLLLDAISCPYIELKDRGTLVKISSKKLGLSLKGVSNRECEDVATEMEKRPWFVKWDKIDLLNMIEKKELSAVY